MKKILLASILSFSLLAGFAQTSPCISEYKINNGGGNCPDIVRNGQTISATGTVTLTFTFTLDPNNLPTVVRAVDITNPATPIDVTDVTFGPGNLNNNGTVTYCYYLGPNNNNNLLGARAKFSFVIIATVGGQPVRCGTDEIPLPVHFSSFTANRQSSTVAITWTTAFEQDNKGFYVQRNVNGEWKNIAFVFSQATAGNSSSALSYEYKDLNTVNGITQYRIQQVDIDGRTKYTDIRAVRGEGQASKIVAYPNPSSDGKVNIVFEDNSGLRDVQVSDLQGRIVKSFRSVANNILVIEKLTSGFYTIKVTNKSTAATSVQKVVVK